MAKLNLDKIGRSLCKVKGGKYNNKVVSVSEKENSKIKQFESMKLLDGKFQQIPNLYTERECGFISGPSGSGKSTWIYNYLVEYKKKKPKNEIYLFSILDDDVSLDAIKPLRIRIDDNLQDFDINNFKDSMVIFDDTDVISNKSHKGHVNAIRDKILQIGRHSNIDCLITSHIPTGHDLKMVLNECSFVVYFPSAGQVRQINYMLINYVGIDLKQIAMIKSLKSRWACIYKNFPQICLTEKTIFLLN